MRFSFFLFFPFIFSLDASTQLNEMVQGDFNGDGKQETAKFVTIYERKQEGGYDPMYIPGSYAIEFSDKKIPTVNLGDYKGELLVKKDFNKNSKDELMVVGNDGEGLHYGLSYILYEFQKENMQSLFNGSMPPLLATRNCHDSLIIPFNDTVYLLSHPPLLDLKAWFTLKAQKIHPVLETQTDTITKSHVLYPYVKNFVADSVLFNNRIYFSTEMDTIPKFSGGKQLLNDYLMKNIKYPSTARDEDIQGTVYISFVVEKDGSLGNFKTKKSPHEILDKELIRVYKNMPKWEPGVKKGKKVRTEMSGNWEFDLEK